jgi:hypothetical protein
MTAARILCSFRLPFDITPEVAWQAPGQSLEDHARNFAALPENFASYGTICLNGDPMPRDCWALIRTKPPASGRSIELTFHLPPRGKGSGGGKKILGLIASIALSLTGGWILNGGLATKFGLAKFAAGSTMAYVAAAGVQIIGSLLLSALVPPPVSNQDDARRFRNDGASSATGNVLAPNGAIPRVAGERKIFPPLGQEPLIYFDGPDEVVEAAYVLAGPHQLRDIRIGAATANDLPGCEIETREGWPGDLPLWLLRRQSRTEMVQSELRGHTTDASDESLLDSLLDVAEALPAPTVVATRPAPDEQQLQIIFAQGLHYQGEETTRIRVPLRLRMRARGATTWRNLPELHFQGATLRQMRATIRLVWTSAAATPAAASTEGWVEARRASPDQTAVPAGGGWAADTAFGASGDDWMAAGNLGSTGVDGVSLDRYTATIHLDPALWPPGAWEIEMIRGASFLNSAYSASAYTFGGSVWALFGYRNPAVPAIVRSRGGTSDGVMLLRSVSIWNATPVLSGDLAVIAVRARNRQLDAVSVLAGGWVPDWDGTAWRNWVVTDNPAPHFRDILAGRLNADPLPQAVLDDAGLLAWRSHCTSKGYKVNALLEGQSVPAAAQIVAACGYARPYWSDIWGVVMDRDRSADAPVQMFTPRNSAGFSWRRALPRLPDGLRVTFRDAALDYEARQITVLRPGGADTGIFEQVEYEGLTTEAEVRARALYDLAQPSLRGTSYSIEAPAEAVRCRRGSLVAVQHDIIHRHGGSGRVGFVWVDDAGNVAALDLDATVPVRTRPGFDTISDMGAVPDMSLIGARSAAMIRRKTGLITIHELQGDGDTAELMFTSPIPPAGIAEDVLVTVGLAGRETLRAIVTDIAPREDYRAALTLTDEAPALHG